MWRQGEACKKFGLTLMFTHDTICVWPQLKPRKSFDIWDTLVEIKSTYKVKEVQPIKHLMCFSCYWKSLFLSHSIPFFMSYVSISLFDWYIDLSGKNFFRSNMQSPRSRRRFIPSRHSLRPTPEFHQIHSSTWWRVGRSGGDGKSYFIINRKVNLFKCLPSARWSVRRLEKCHGL